MMKVQHRLDNMVLANVTYYTTQYFKKPYPRTTWHALWFIEDNAKPTAYFNGSFERLYTNEYTLYTGRRYMEMDI